MSGFSIDYFSLGNIYKCSLDFIESCNHNGLSLHQSKNAQKYSCKKSCPPIGCIGCKISQGEFLAPYVTAFWVIFTHHFTTGFVYEGRNWSSSLLFY